jgi:hypothetical protein
MKTVFSGNYCCFKYQHIKEGVDGSITTKTCLIVSANPSWRHRLRFTPPTRCCVYPTPCWVGIWKIERFQQTAENTLSKLWFQQAADDKAPGRESVRVYAGHPPTTTISNFGYVHTDTHTQTHTICPRTMIQGCLCYVPVEAEMTMMHCSSTSGFLPVAMAAAWIPA